LTVLFSEQLFSSTSTSPAHNPANQQNISAFLSSSTSAHTNHKPNTEMASTSKALEVALAEAQTRFEARNSRSAALHAEASTWLPGGNTRTTLHTAPFPIYMSSGKGHTVTSEDGHVYTDLVGELSAGLYGHSHPVLTSAIQEVISTVGLNLGAQTVHETALAKAMCERFNLKRVRFTNSGTEATLHALAAARRFTGKRKVVVFGGGYHGSAFMFGGGKRADNNVDMADWIVVKYNDLDVAKKRIHMDGVAACLVEGMQGSGGGIPGREHFLTGVQEACRDVS
jgi:glutamate-1-semialdehyde 2,1-aminomutase